MTYHLISVRMDTIKKKENKCWQRCEEIGTLLLYWWECTMVPQNFLNRITI